MNYTEFSAAFEASQHRHDAWMEVLYSKAVELAVLFRTSIEAPEAVSVVGVPTPVVQVVETTDDPTKMARLSRARLDINSEGVLPFTITVLFPNGSGYFRHFIFLAVRTRDGQAEYAMWDAPDARRLKEKEWYAGAQILTVMNFELHSYFNHAPELGEFNLSSVR
ncbi:MAG TPA: hypothetical protein VF861_14540 [Telluria sp.]